MTATDSTGPEMSRFTAVLLAGDRGPDDPVAEHAGTSCKAIVDIEGRPMITRVLDALLRSDYVDTIIVCGPSAGALEECAEIQPYLERDDIQHMANLDSPSLSVESALSRVSRDKPVFLTTADHALLETQLVDYFLEKSSLSGADVNVGLVNYKTIQDRFPQVKRTVLKFADGGVCGCNLFSFNNETGRQIAPFWRKVEQKRKQPWKLVLGLLGPLGVVKYVANKLSLDGALQRISRGLQMQVNAVVLPFPQAGVDVDSVGDLEFVRGILGRKEQIQSVGK